MIFSIFRFFCTLRFQIYKYCPIITNHTSMEIWFTQLIQMMHEPGLCSGVTCNNTCWTLVLCVCADSRYWVLSGCRTAGDIGGICPRGISRWWSGGAPRCCCSGSRPRWAGRSPPKTDWLVRFLERGRAGTRGEDWWRRQEPQNNHINKHTPGWGLPSTPSCPFWDCAL